MGAPQRIVYDLPPSVGETASIVRQDSGPLYAYAPGESLHRVDARDFVPHVWSGLVTPICDYANWRERNSGSMAVIGPSVDGKSELARIHASVTRELVIEAQEWRGAKVFEVTAFTHWDVRQLDINRFNHLICPFPFGYAPIEVPAKDCEPYEVWGEYSKVRQIPEEIQQEIDKPGGVLALRLAWLREAQKRLDTVPLNLRPIYGQAIEELVTANETYKRYCEWHLAGREREIKERQGKLTYDHYDAKVLWYLGRKPIDVTQQSQQSQQPIIVQMPAGSASGGLTPESISAAMAEGIAAGIQRGIAEAQPQPARSSNSRRSAKKRDSHTRHTGRGPGETEPTGQE